MVVVSKCPPTWRRDVDDVRTRCCRSDLPGEGSTERGGTPSRSINTLTNLAGWQTCRPSEEAGQGRQRTAVTGT